MIRRTKEIIRGAILGIMYVEVCKCDSKATFSNGVLRLKVIELKIELRSSLKLK
jgi:hypothetical protein